MDTVNIESKFMRNIVASAAEKALHKTLGADVSVAINDKLEASFDGDWVRLRVNAELLMETDEFRKLLGV